METLEQAVAQVRAIRQDIVDLETEISDIEAQLAETELGKLLATAKAYLVDLRVMKVDAETVAKELGLQAFLSTGNKKPYAGVEVKIFSVAEITDRGQALQWIVSNVTDPEKYVKFDERKFASDTSALQLPFVQKSEEPRVQLASKL